jgi:hypothetical protein
MYSGFLFGGGSYDILHLSKDARSLSLHNAASAYDRSFLQNNPAALSLATERNSYSSLILPAGIHSGEIQRVRKMGSGIRAGKLSYISYGTIYDSETQKKTTAYDILLEMGYKKELKNIVSVGISGGYLLSSICGYRSQLLYTNIGIRSRMMRKRIGLGFSLENVGFLITSYTDVKESIPAIFRTALYYKPKYLPAIISVDIIRNLDGGIVELFGGLEFNPEKRLTIRLGCSSRRRGFLTDDFPSDLLAAVSGGAGFKFNKINLDIGFMNLGSSGYIIGFSISNKRN